MNDTSPERAAFYARLDAAIRSGLSSGDIGRAFNVRSETVRRRRRFLRECGELLNVQKVESIGARFHHDEVQ